MNETYNKNYLFKVWALSLFLAPVIFFAVGCIREPGGGDFEPGGLIYLIFISLIFSTFLSLPTLLILYFVTTYLYKTKINAPLFKVIVCTLSIAGIFTTFFVMDYAAIGEYLLIHLSYSGGVIISALLFKLKMKQQELID